MMKNKYMILALALTLFQGTLHCEDQFKDIDQMIMPQLQSAQKAMNSNIKLELQAILDALISFAKKNANTASAAVDQMKSIKAVLAKYRTEEYKTTWDNICWFFGSNPKKVVEEIDPAITKVNNALNTVSANSSKLGYKTAAVLAASVAALTVLVTPVIASVILTEDHDYDDEQDDVPANSHCGRLNIEAAYATLGLNYKTANPAAAKSAYKELARTHHPDKGGDPEEFKKINNANNLIQECAIS